MQQDLTVALSQIAPVWCDRDTTLEKVIAQIEEAASEGAGLVAFGEALVPGYPFWVTLTNGAEFESPIQKELFAHYAENAVCIERGDLKSVCEACADNAIACYLGVVERAGDRSGVSLYCSFVFISAEGDIGSVHRKLMPTYEERLVWSTGDGHGLRVHPVGPFTVGGLNCWENWMPLSRAALYAQGETLHVGCWPGGLHNTEDITRFIAKESRSYVVSVSGLMRRQDFPASTPHLGVILEQDHDVYANGGSCVAAPNGEWCIPPAVGEECLQITTLDFRQVLEERQNFDPAGHYSRPDVTRMTVDRQRQGIAHFVDG